MYKGKCEYFVFRKVIFTVYYADSLLFLREIFCIIRSNSEK